LDKRWASTARIERDPRISQTERPGRRGAPPGATRKNPGKRGRWRLHPNTSKKISGVGGRSGPTTKREKRRSADSTTIRGGGERVTPRRTEQGRRCKKNRQTNVGETNRNRKRRKKRSLAVKNLNKKITNQKKKTTNQVKGGEQLTGGEKNKHGTTSGEWRAWVKKSPIRQTGKKGEQHWRGSPFEPWIQWKFKGWLIGNVCKQTDLWGSKKWLY